MSLDAVGLEVMAHAFASVAEEMGLVLIHSAVSPNIRERRDCSAALFDPDGEMLAQAAHIPVHLGALAESVAAVRTLDPGPGELFILNDPYTGGSHLPDITLIGAIEVEGALGGYGVVRAHHSDVGGVQPGSMPAGAREIFAEGVILPPLRLTADVERFLLANVRTPEIRGADLEAQRAAVQRGAEGLRALAARYGTAGLRAAAGDLLAYAERRTREALRRIDAPQGGLTATDWLEGDGVDDLDLPIAVRVDIEDGCFHADFTGTAPAARGNVNCPLAVARSAVLFVVRTLVPEDVPTNGGVQRAVRVTAPAGCLVNARYPSAVAAGNVETSQRIVDTLFLALAGGGVRVPAQGQGTMNNVTFGGLGARDSGLGGGWTYYETIGGGQGASAGAPGPSGVHVGMSNTRNTPIEVLEMEYPLRLKTYSLRRGSGGAGRWAGGEGVAREFEALAPMEASILAERRRHPPRGVAGGGRGALGRTLLNGAPLASKVSTLLEPGDVLRVETPGGGGWGASQPGDER